MMPSAIPSIPDRELHDLVIRYLTDANLRCGIEAMEFLDPSEAERANKFSRFLARRYYRDRLLRAHRYSRLVRPGHSAERVVDSPDFEEILANCVLGSLATSERVGELAAIDLLNAAPGHVWWNELIEYERAFFLQLATSESQPSKRVPQKNTSTVLRKFSVSIPELLEAIGSNQTLGCAFAAEVTLLFSRTHLGRIYVTQPDASAVAVFDALDGHRSAEEVASFCNISAEENQRILTALSDIGSIVLPAA